MNYEKKGLQESGHVVSLMKINEKQSRGLFTNISKVGKKNLRNNKNIKQFGGGIFGGGGVSLISQISCASRASCSSNKPGFIYKNGSDFRWIKSTERRLRKKR